jgi:hypothetical protein
MSGKNIKGVADVVLGMDSSPERILHVRKLGRRVRRDIGLRDGLQRTLDNAKPIVTIVSVWYCSLSSWWFPHTTIPCY